MYGLHHEKMIQFDGPTETNFSVAFQTLAKFHHCVDSDSEPETDNHPDDGERSMSPMAFESTTS